MPRGELRGFCLDSPRAGAEEPLITPIEVDGWVYPPNEVDRVRVTVDERYEYDAIVGIPRRDVSLALGRTDARDSGFICPLGADVVSPGRHVLRIDVFRAGALAESVTREFEARSHPRTRPGEPFSTDPGSSPPIPTENPQMVDEIALTEGDRALAQYRVQEVESRIAYALRRVQEVERERDELKSEYDELKSERDELKSELDVTRGSRSWRLTRPLRAASQSIKALGRHPSQGSGRRRSPERGPAGTPPRQDGQR